MNIPTLAEVKVNLATDKAWALRGLVRLYELQTNDEQSQETTKENNGVGFTYFDANLLTSFAKFYINRQFLSDRQMSVLFKRMPKYAGQLHAIAQAKALQPS